MWPIRLLKFVFTGTGGKQKPPTPCPVGHYCPPGTKHPMQHKCAPGTWSNRTSLTSEAECLLCPAGWFCVGGAHIPTGMCSSGHYCPQGRQLFAGMKEIQFISVFRNFVDSGEVTRWLYQHIFLHKIISVWSWIANCLFCIINTLSLWCLNWVCWCHYFLSLNWQRIKMHSQVSATSTILNLKLPAKILQYLLNGDYFFFVVVVRGAVSGDFFIHKNMSLHATHINT